MKRRQFGLVLKLALAVIGFASIWVLRAFPWWFLAFSAFTVSLFAIEAIRNYRRGSTQKQDSPEEVHHGRSPWQAPERD